MNIIRDTITSIGLILLDSTEKSILCVQSASTYPGNCLMAGRRWYSVNDLDEHFVDEMTLEEKKLFLQCDAKTGFSYFLTNFRKCYSKKLSSLPKERAIAFERTSLRDYISSMKILREKMKVSFTNGALPWSFPKGRGHAINQKMYKTKKDYEIAIALHEMFEDTRISSDMLNVMGDIPPFVISYDDMGIKYVFRLYFAVANESCNGKIDESDFTQTRQVAAIEWLTKEALACKPLCVVTRHNILGNFDAIFEHYRKWHGRASV